jgi:hypothetical protein
MVETPRGGFNVAGYDRNVGQHPHVILIFGLGRSQDPDPAQYLFDDLHE